MPVMDSEASSRRLKDSVAQLNGAVRWFADPPLSLRSWGVRILIASIVLLLLVAILSLASTRQLLFQMEQDRATRTDRTCLILTKLEATPQEKRDAGCP